MRFDIEERAECWLVVNENNDFAMAIFMNILDGHVDGLHFSVVRGMRRYESCAGSDGNVVALNHKCTNPLALYFVGAIRTNRSYVDTVILWGYLA